jgi:hypothetical protein
MEQDRKTRLAVKASYLETALSALRKAIVQEDDDARRGDLTEATAAVSMHKRLADSDYADVREAEARLAHTLLDS